VGYFAGVFEFVAAVVLLAVVWFAISGGCGSVYVRLRKWGYLSSMPQIGMIS